MNVSVSTGTSPTGSNARALTAVLVLVSRYTTKPVSSSLSSCQVTVTYPGPDVAATFVGAFGGRSAVESPAAAGGEEQR